MKNLICALSLICIFSLSLNAVAKNQLNVYTSDSKGFNTHTFWYDDGKEVTVIDTQFVPQLAEKAIQDIRNKTESPITRVIITHPNPDKFNGLSALHAIGAKSVSSKATANSIADVHAYKKYYFVNIAKKFTNDTYPKSEAIMETFDDKKTIRLASGETITLFELANPGISSTQTVVRIDSTGDLLVGDLVHHNAHAWLEGGIVNGKPAPNIKSWIQAVDELKSIGGVKTVHGGRGESAELHVAVKKQKAYLSKVNAITTQYVNNLGEQKSELFNSETSTQHYKKLQSLIAAEFPDYQISYMIKYGIYGLAQHIANQ